MDFSSSSEHEEVTQLWAAKPDKQMDAHCWMSLVTMISLRGQLPELPRCPQGLSTTSSYELGHNNYTCIGKLPP